MINKRAYLTSITFALIIAVLLIGCESKPTEVTIDPHANNTQPNDSTEQNKPVIPEPNQVEEPITEPVKENDTEISSNQEPDQTAEEDSKPNEQSTDSTDDKPKEIKEPEPNYDVVTPYNPNKPTLMGLTINQSKDLIRTKFGEPIEEYVMDDPQDPITVYAYPGFLIGFNNKNLIAFIDVNSNSVNPGLNGLRLGDTVKAAIEALGSPNRRTDYVLNYTSAEVTLKLDIDPNTNAINSIKLFSAN